MKINTLYPAVFILATTLLLASSCKKDEETPLIIKNERGDVHLTLINNTSSANSLNTLVFQVNLADTSYQNPYAVAWKIIENFGMGDYHPFDFPLNIDVNVADEYGNYTPELLVNYGEMYEATESTSGLILQYLGESQYFDIFSIVNHYSTNVGSYIYRNNKLLATKPINKDAYGRFSFNHSIVIIPFIGECPYVEGEVFSYQDYSELTTEFDLTGIESADIIATGGPNEFTYTMGNIVYIQ